MVDNGSVVQRGQSDSGDGSTDNAIDGGVRRARLLMLTYGVVICTLCVVFFVFVPLLVESIVNPDSQIDILEAFDPKRVNESFFKNIDSFSFLGVMATVGLAATVASFDRARNALRLSDQFTDTSEKNYDKRKRYVTHLVVLQKIVIVEGVVTAGIAFLLLLFAYSRWLGEGEWTTGLIALLLVSLLVAGFMASGIISSATISTSLVTDQERISKRKNQVEQAKMLGVYVYWGLVGFLFVAGVVVLSLLGDTGVISGIGWALLWMPILFGWGTILFSLFVWLLRKHVGGMLETILFLLLSSMALLMCVLTLCVVALEPLVPPDSDLAVVLVLGFLTVVIVLFWLRVLGDNGYTRFKGFMKMRLSLVNYPQSWRVENGGKENASKNDHPWRTIFKAILVVVLSILWVLPVAWRWFEFLLDESIGPELIVVIAYIVAYYVFACSVVFGGLTSIYLSSQGRVRHFLTGMVPVFVFAFVVAECGSLYKFVPVWTLIVALLSAMCVVWMTSASVQPSKCLGAGFWFAPRIVWTEIHNSSAKKTKERMEESIRKSDKVYGREKQHRTA